MTISAQCPVSIGGHTHVQMAHGGGGRLMAQLLEKVFLSTLNNPLLGQGHDGTILPHRPEQLAFTTDSYVVRPLFFPGGDIGTLAVNGTVNDLAMCGARPRWISAAFILEEGLSIETLSRVVRSMRESADSAGVELVTGDTKVVDRGKGDGLYVTTAGIGTVEHTRTIAASQVCPGDAVLISGDLARHGMAVMSVREGLTFETTIESDCAPLWSLVELLLQGGIELHCLRDLTRGGLASALNEIAQASHVHITLDDASIPVDEQVRGACEILGLDPLYVANEGRMVVFVPWSEHEAALALMRSHPSGLRAATVGRVVQDGPPGVVSISSSLGTRRILDLLSGEQLPRIC